MEEGTVTTAETAATTTIGATATETVATATVANGVVVVAAATAEVAVTLTATGQVAVIATVVLTKWKKERKNNYLVNDDMDDLKRPPPSLNG